MSPEIREEKTTGPRLCVLCVDDNHDIADSEAHLLQLVGFEARACYSGAEALAEAAVFLPGVCLIDLNMPEMDGDELAHRLRELPYPPVVLVAVTAMSDETSGERIRNAGFDMHLIKPVNPHTLLAVVDELWRAWNKRIGPPGSCSPESERTEDVRARPARGRGGRDCGPDGSVE